MTVKHLQNIQNSKLNGKKRDSVTEMAETCDPASHVSHFKVQHEIKKQPPGGLLRYILCTCLCECTHL